jgi:ADP-heptose:LPS heptosyltransferase
MSIKLNTMRWVDRWVGIPLCAIATPWVLLLDQLRRTRSSRIQTPQRVLFIELSEMGSAIIADPALRDAQRRGAELYFLIFKSNQISLTLAKTVPAFHVLTIDHSNAFAFIKDVFAILYKIRRIKIDTAIDLEVYSRFSALLTGLCGATRRVGFYKFTYEGLWRGEMLTHKVLYNAHQHMAKNFLGLVYAAFSDHQETPFSKVRINDLAAKMTRVPANKRELDRVLLTIQTLAHAAALDFSLGRDKIILLNVNASDLLPQRRWAPERFSVLAEEIVLRWPDCLILLTGSEQEHAYVERVRHASRAKKLLNFAGMVEFSELIALYSLAHVMVTNDSGPSHFSSLTPLKTVVLFGPETPTLYGSLGDSIAIHAGLSCSPCVSAANHRNTSCRDNQCMQAISVNDVMEKIEVHMRALEGLLNSTVAAVKAEIS